ncbi:TetR/AcrR family transcriptional regulator [Paenibacillus sp. PR3]|uniref:TetR/AcrR family transcriptional regulator n=1 Tax=Paenibacillus terricola TaxID=2763503 RepID=A0ABR8MQU7_9BACL|nr:TetR/AcrR family transcriptional regulator [Paenibacillus terricola]MBD3918347.1 TetR/AcrR family transcriptional regulator [Paenibacillus terricola]
MSNKNPNSSVIRTKKAIKTALISLLNEKDIREITIKEIVARAEYTRGAFYAHYQFKEELLDELIQETIEGFLAAFRAPYEGKREEYNIHNLTHSTVVIFQYIQENAAAFSLLFKGTSFGFQEKLGVAIKVIYEDEFELLFPQIPSHINRAIFINQSVYTILGLIRYWIQSNFMYSAQYMTEQMLEIAKWSYSE